MNGQLQIPPNFTNSNHAWDGRPFSGKSSSFRWNALFRERCTLTRLCADLNELLFSSRLPRNGQAFSQAVKRLVEKLSTWYEFLPLELTYKKGLPAPLYELQYGSPNRGSRRRTAYVTH